ncbi:MAG: hypothetical protein ABIM30_00470 [candidate division WOR-3 bacterium]
MVITKDEVIAIIYDLLNNKTSVDVTIPWNSKMRQRAILSAPIKLSFTEDDTILVSWEDDKIIIVKDDPVQIDMKCSKYPNVTITFIPPFEWGAICGFVVSNWEEMKIITGQNKNTEGYQQVKLFS